jgi:hypothetical protein
MIALAHAGGQENGAGIRQLDLELASPEAATSADTADT